jgi:ribosomal protein S3
MVRSRVKIEQSQKYPVPHHSRRSEERGIRIDDLSKHLRKTGALHPIKVVEVVEPKVSAIVQAECVYKQSTNANNRDQS